MLKVAFYAFVLQFVFYFLDELAESVAILASSVVIIVANFPEVFVVAVAKQMICND